MKKKLLSLIIVLSLVLGCAGGAFADFSDFKDISGHWAEKTMERAYSDGLLEGFEDSTIRPDTKITVAQMITILCRVLGTEKSDSVAELGLSGNEWYAKAAGQALHLGLISGSTGDLNAAMTRLEAFKMLSRAFQLSVAEPDYSAAAGYSDFSSLGSEDARIIASLVEGGYIQGYNRSLQLSSGITRAEFVTVLYRVAENFVSADRAGSVSGSAVLSGNANLNGTRFTGSVWLAANANSVTLRTVTAPQLTIRSEQVGISNFYGNSIERLVIANNNGNLAYTVDSASDIRTIAVGDGGGIINLGGSLKTVETIGQNRSLNISGSAETVLVSGSGNTVTVNPGVTVGTLRISGEGNTVIVNGSVTDLVVVGSGTVVKGSGYAETYTLEALDADVKLTYGEFVDDRAPGIRNVGLVLECPGFLPAGETLSATVTFVNVSEDVDCTGTWYLDGKVLQTGHVTVTEGGASTITYNFNYTRDMAATSELKYVLDNTTEIGEVQQVSASAVIEVENHDEEWFERYEVSRVLSTVTSRYAGNYTLQWALDNDYDQQTKTIWMNAKGYSSTTKYIIWVNLTYQRVNIFEGSKGNWTLIHEYLCGSGAGDCTPRGTFTVFGRSAAGWTTSTYNCRPVVNFKTGSGYAFHSRLYDPTHSYLTDPSIGFPVSHGCIRMYDEDVQWIYDNIPTGTTVVVY